MFKASNKLLAGRIQKMFSKIDGRFMLKRRM